LFYNFFRGYSTRYSVAPYFQSVIGEIRSLPEWVENAGRAIPELEREINSLQQAINEPFKYEKEYQETMKRKKEIDVELQSLAGKKAQMLADE